MVAHTPARVHFTLMDGGGSTLASGQLTTPLDFHTGNELIDQLGEMQVGGTPLSDLLRHREVSLWQFLPAWIWPSVHRAAELVDLLAPLVDELKPDSLEVTPVSDLTAPIWNGVVSAVAASRGLPLEGHLHASRDPAPARSPLRLAGSAARQLLGTARTSLTIARPRRRRWARAGDMTLLFATLGSRHWVNIPGRPNDDDYHDEQFSPALSALRERGWRRFRFVDCEGIPPDRLDERAAEPDVDWLAFDEPARSLTLQEVLARTRMRRCWRTLRSDPTFQASFQRRGISLMPALAPELEHAFCTLAPLCVSYLMRARRLLAQVRPEAVLVTYETGPRQRALMIEAWRARIPTVGLQHGIIFDNHYDYMHRSVTTEPLGSSGFAIPRTTCLWGWSWAETLTCAGVYPENSVVVTGSPRHDRAIELAAEMGRSGARAVLGLDGHDAPLVLALSANRDVRRYLDACCDGVASDGQAGLLVKMHPADDPAIAESVLARFPRRALVVPGGRLFEAIIAADVVITQPSTTVGEALLLDRPVIVVDIAPGDYSVLEHYGEGGALTAHSSAGLRDAVQSLLHDGATRERLASERHLLVERWFLAADGRSAERFADVVARIAGH